MNTHVYSIAYIHTSTSLFSLINFPETEFPVYLPDPIVRIYPILSVTVKGAFVPESYENITEHQSGIQNMTTTESDEIICRKIRLVCNAV